MAIVISSVGTKGGTGKTSVVKNLGYTKVKEGKKVLLIDLCQNSDVATKLGFDRESFEYDTYSWVAEGVPFEDVVQFDDETGLYFIPASERVEEIVTYVRKTRIIRQEWVLEEAIAPLQDQFDYIIFDNHPTETNRMLTFSLVASDIALIPTIMDMSSVVATMRTMILIKQLQDQGINIKYAVLPHAVDFSKGFGKELKDIEEEFRKDGVENFTTAVRYSATISRASLNGDVFNMTNKYMLAVLEDFKVISKEVDEIIEHGRILEKEEVAVGITSEGKGE
ncbi:ParA family protein [Priestia megaterium]|uniref:ParA family protein n=1 Tax=Priestia megaterium TaxID=1404 RepID=UPI000BFDD1FB|nr:ParA family protein [Priestia megaterium]PGQ88318.1 hypothetical protein COA18_05155 [Priestia megaterium]